MIHMNYQTLDFDAKLINQPKHKSLTGRKKGFVNQKYCKNTNLFR